MSDKLIKRTPCIGVCSTTYGDDICRGCKRFRHEVTGWINYSDNEKDIVNRRLEKFKILVLKDKFKVTDKKLLLSKLLEARISFNQDLDPLCWVFDLLRSTSLDGLNIKELGLAVMPDFDQVSLSDLRDEINKEFFELSEAHYTRYIQPKSFN